MSEHQVEVCGVEKSKQTSILWLTLPDDHVSDITEKIYKEIKEDLRTGVMVTKFLPVMAKAFKPAEQNQVLKAFLDFFVIIKRGNREENMEIITRFYKSCKCS